MKTSISNQATPPYGTASLKIRHYLSAALEGPPLGESARLGAAFASPPPAEALGLRAAIKTVLSRIGRDLSVLFEHSPIPEHAWLKAADSSAQTMPRP